MDFKKLEDLLNLITKSRKELWNLSYEELEDIYMDLEDYLDEIDILKVKLEKGVDKVGEILDDFEDEDYWDEETDDEGEE
ncbi:hypothetical protein J7L48_05675 [bacterium]|nr:hypothetical protein [bacterium]